MYAKYLSILASCLVMASGGTLAIFSIFSSRLTSLGITNPEIGVISAWGNTALFVSFFAIGPIFDRFGGNPTLLLGTISVCMGYTLILLTFTSILPASPSLFSVYFFMAGFGSCANYMVAVGTAIQYPEKEQGVIVGVLMLSYGISGLLYSQIFSVFFSAGAGNYRDFLLTIIFSVLGINVIGAVFIAPKKSLAPTSKEVIDGAAPMDLSGTNGNIETTLISNPKVTHLEETQGNSIKSIISSPSFWLYLSHTMFVQGLTYMTNISLIVSAFNTGSTSESLLQISALHLTVISAAQAVGRLSFAVLSGGIIRNGFIYASPLLVIGNFIVLIPNIILALLKTNSNAVLIVCSVLVGGAYGAIGAIFPILVRNLFGARNFGSACALLLGPVPVGIFVSNILFAKYTASPCTDVVCFRTPFLILSILQVGVLVASFILLIIRMRMRNDRSSQVFPQI